MWWERLRRGGGDLLAALERTILPNSCVSCERAIERAHPDALVCGTCRSRLVALAGGCGRCGQPLPPVGPCRFCASWPDALTWARSAVWLGDEARGMVHHLKYEGYVALGVEIARVIGRHVRRPVAGIIVPIPLGARRLRQRGYNQAAVIARALAAQWRLPLGESALTRVRETSSQTALDPERRRGNVANAFRARPAPIGGDTGRWASTPAVILVDDVLTTGATVAASAAALADAGWSSIGAVTFARALPFERHVHVTEARSGAGDARILSIDSHTHAIPR